MTRRRLLSACCALALGALAGGVLYLRADKSAVFLETAGRLRAAPTLRAFETERSKVRLVELVNDRGEDVTTALLRRPLAPAPDRHVLVTYAGAKTGERILELIPERDDLVLAAVQYPYERPRSPAEYLRYPYHLRQSVFRAVAGGILVVSLLESEGEPLGRLTVVGASLGSVFATIHGALDGRVPTVVLVHGGGDFDAILRANADGLRSEGWPPWLARLAAALLIESFDPVRYAGRISPRRLVVIGARNDRYFPEESVRAVYAAAAEPKELFWNETEHVRSEKNDVTAELVRQIERYLDGLGDGD